MNKILLIIILILISTPAWSATYYTRYADGGTSTQCDGTHDAAQSGAVDSGDAGTTPDCAFNHIFYALGWYGAGTSDGTAGIMVGGDTLIIKDESVVGYTVGFSGCSTSYPYGCVTRPIPSGTVGNTTKICGANYSSCSSKSDYTKVWGRERAQHIFDLAGGDYIDFKCLDITDKSSCVANVLTQSLSGASSYVCNRSGSYPLGNHADTGIKSFTGTSTNVTFENVYIHGLVNGVLAQKKQDWTMTDFESSFNSSTNWDNDIDGDGSGTPNNDLGHNIFIRTKFNWSGCGEVWDSPGTPYYCTSQDQGGYGDSYGTGGGNDANNTFTDVEMSYNVSDAIDNLYDDGTGTTLKINRGKFQGNAGQTIKSSGELTYVENTVAIGNCGFFKNQSFTTFAKEQAGRSGTSCNNNAVCNDNENSTNCLWTDSNNNGVINTGEGDCPAFNNCRAGSIFTFANKAGDQKWYNKNSTFYSNGDVLFGMVGANVCNAGTVYDSRNTYFINGVEFNDGADLSDTFYSDGSGTCADGTFTPTGNYNYVINSKNGSSDISGQANSTYSTSVSRFIGTVPLNTSYLTAIDSIPNFYLVTPTNDANTSVVCQGDCSLDYQSFVRGGTWDIGGIEYGSTSGGGSSTVAAINKGLWRGILRGRLR